MPPVLLTPEGADVRRMPPYFQSANICTFWEYISELMPASGAVPASAFDMMDVHRLVPDIMICDVDAQSCRQRVRFAGTRIASVLHQETTGRYLDEINVGPYRSQQLAAFNMAVATGWPQWTHVSIVSASGGLPKETVYAGICYERLVVPLAGSDSSITQLASIMDFSDTKSGMKEFQHREITPLRN